MRQIIPSRATVLALTAGAAVCAAALGAGAPLRAVAQAGGAALALGAVWAVVDLWRSLRSWQRHPLRTERALPDALALGVPRALQLTLVNDSPVAWAVDVFDEVDPRLDFEGLPQHLRLPSGKKLALRYTVTPRQRGPVQLGATQLRLRSLGGSFELLRTIGTGQRLHVFPSP